MGPTEGAIVRAGRTMQRYRNAVADLLWTPACPACGERAEHPREELCEDCWSRLVPARADRTPPLEGTPILLAAWRVEARFLTALAASKYGRRRDVGRRLAREATAHLAARLPPGDLVPVPISRAKRRERGFNQPEDFARALAVAAGRSVGVEVLRRRRDRGAVAGRRRDRRADRVRDAFDAGPGASDFDGRPLILVDDVVTTGATATECLLALGRAGLQANAIVTMGRATNSDDDAAGDLLEALAGW